MTTSLNETPRADRLHIALFGRRNSGKSSLINRLTGHETALVSDVPGTTTDPVYKSMELAGIGAVVLIDTAGFDDEGTLGALRVEKTREVLDKTDVALLVFSGELSVDDPFTEERAVLLDLRARKTPVLALLNKTDLLEDPAPLCQAIEKACGLSPLPVSAKDPRAQGDIRAALLRLLPEDYGSGSIVGHLVSPGDTVLLVMPQDIQAPKGRLILPQVQVTRDLLDRHAVVVSVTVAELPLALSALKAPPKLIITDSQVFPLVYEKKPAESLLTSFSVLFACHKGDIRAFVRGAEALSTLHAHSRVLIAEACTHAPLSEDIGRVKIPRMLKKRFGDTLQIELVSGSDFPSDLSGYDLIVHCGACMFNRKYVLSRVAAAEKAGVPITNYGVLIAGLTGILDKIVY